MANAPGWYPDPWQPGRRRWWDGNGWTDHTFDPNAPAVPTTMPAMQGPVRPAPAYFAPPDPWRDVHDEEQSAVWARRAFVGWAAVRVVTGIASIFIFNT